MKVCPSCQSRYDQGEEFCPNDGTELVDAREVSPGELTGRTLGDVVELEELDRKDPLGERYRGRLVDGSRDVAVTVFNEAAAPKPGRDSLVAPLAEVLSEEIPPEILAVHSVETDGDPSYVVEQSPDGDSLRTILEDREHFDWERATRLTAHLAQALHWMGERGHIHRGVYPGAIYLTDPESGAVQVGDWVQALATHHDDPLEDAGGGTFVGFASYLPPEAIREGQTPDERSLVYTLGMIYYELILGKPPFSSGDTEAMLKRQLHEKPLKLSIAAGDRELPDAIDEILSMMWAKDPSDRFQTPKATIAPLADLVGAEPHRLATVPREADAPVFSDDSPGSPDLDQEEASSDADAGGETLMGVAPPTTSSSTDEGTADGETPAPPARAVQDTAPMEREDEEEKSVGVSGSVEVPTADEGLASGSSEVRSGEAAIDASTDERERPSSSEHPSIIIEDPELESAASPDDDSGSETDAANSPDVSSWTEALETSVRIPSREAILTGFSEVSGQLHRAGPSQQNRVPVRTRDLTASASSMSADGGGGEPAVEINPDAARQENPQSAFAETEPTQVDGDIKSDVEQAKSELEREAKSDGADTELPSPEEAGSTAEDSDANDEEVIVLDETSSPEEGEEEEQEDGSQQATQMGRPQPPDLPSTPDESSNDSSPEAETTSSSVPAGGGQAAESGSTTTASGSTQTGMGGGASSGTTSADSGSSGTATGSSQTGDDVTAPDPNTGAATGGPPMTPEAETDAEVTDEWFEVSDKEAWMASDVRKERDRSEVIRRYATWGFLILVVTAALGLIIFSQTYSPADEKTKQKSEKSAGE